MKKVLISSVFGVIAALSFSGEVKAGNVPNWTGEADWDYTVACLDTPTNARLNPNFGNNVRATLVGNTCGNPLVNRFGLLMYENGFLLVEFYFDEVGEWRRYWIHETQIENIYR